MYIYHIVQSMDHKCWKVVAGSISLHPLSVNNNYVNAILLNFKICIISVANYTSSYQTGHCLAVIYLFTHAIIFFQSNLQLRPFHNKIISRIFLTRILISHFKKDFHKITGAVLQTVVKQKKWLILRLTRNIIF